METVKSKRSPLGLRPRWIVDQLRKEEISQAIAMIQSKADRAIPIEWVEEYNEIQERLNNREVYKPINGIANGHFTANESLQ